MAYGRETVKPARGRSEKEKRLTGDSNQKGAIIGSCVVFPLTSCMMRVEGVPFSWAPLAFVLAVAAVLGERASLAAGPEWQRKFRDWATGRAK